MKIVTISDTHTKHNLLDLSTYDKESTLVVAGDVTSSGSCYQVISFLDWLEAQDFKHKLMIAGNHDFYMEKFPVEFKKLLKKYPSVTYLENSGVTIDGIKFWGSPDTPEFCNWAFNKTPTELEQTWAQVPKDTDVLITHGPPKAILDRVNNKWSPDPHVGCPALGKMVLNSTIRYCVVGHIHEQGGRTQMVDDVTFINAAVLDETYLLAHKPVEFTVEECSNVKKS